MENHRTSNAGGSFLAVQGPHRGMHRRASRRLEWVVSLAVLVTVDGVLIYMIAVCMIQPGIGAGLVALISGYIGYYL